MSNASIQQIFKINPRFLRSTQLERDFTDPKALEGYVTTPEVRSYLRRISKGLNRESGQRAWRITGDFGSGKSSFALLLANLLGRQTTDLPKHIRPLRQELGLSRVSNNYLPVLITGSREPIHSAIFRSLYDSLLNNVDGRKKLGSIPKLKACLEGSVTIPDRHAVELIAEVSKELVEKKLFGGLLIILDELGKFLEFAALHPEKQDVYFLQLLGEASSRSGKAPIVTIGLLHQGFSAYAGRLSDATQKEWEKIGGRFDGLSFTQPLTQVATLISEALGIRSLEGLRGWKTRAREDMLEAVELGMFGSSVGKTALSELAPGLYPIHSTVLPILNRFFRRFGQNERSLFSFLLSSEPHGLTEFANQPATATSIYRLSNFYDFAAENFSHRLSTQSFRSHWNHIDAVIRSYPEEDELSIQILKTVGILNVIESHDLQATREIISLALGHPPDLDKRLSELAHDKHMLFNRGIVRGFSLWPNTSVNLEQAFVEATEQVTSIPPISEIVRERLDNRPIVARRHYISTGTLRHFSVQFMTVDELANSNIDLPPRYPADGNIAVILCEKTDDQDRAVKFVTEQPNQPQVVFAISPVLEELHAFALELERWQWVLRQTLELKDDRFATEEVARQISTISASIENWLQQYFNFRACGYREGSGARWYYAGESVEELIRDKSVQSFLSELCSDKLFPNAPLVYNELVNRHSISAAAAAARQRLFKGMLENASFPRLGISEDKAPPEKSMYFSLLQEGGLHQEVDGEFQICFPQAGKRNDRLNFRPALDAIVKCLEEVPDSRVEVGEIYDMLRGPEFGIRDGVIPILLLVVLVVHETEIAVYEDSVFQPEIDEHLLQRFAKVPRSFEFQLCRINGVRRQIVSKLAKVLGEKQSTNGDLLSIVKPLYSFVVELPLYVRHTESLSPETLAFRKAIENAREPANLIFQAIPQAFGIRPKEKNLNSDALAKALKASISELRRSFPDLQGRMATALLRAFDVSEMSLSEWRQQISMSAEIVVVGVTDSDLRSFCLKLIDDQSPDSDWLESLGSFISRCPPSRWKDKDEEIFNKRIPELVGQYNRVLATCFEKDGSLPDTAIRLAITPRSGVESDYILKLTPLKKKQSEELSKKLRNSLSADSETSIFTLTQLLLDLLKKNK